MGRRQRMGWIHIEQKVSRYRRVYLPHRSSNSDEKGEMRIGGSYIWWQFTDREVIHECCASVGKPSFSTS